MVLSCLSVCASRNIVNALSCRVFGHIFPDTHNGTEMNASQFGVKKSKVKITVE